MFCVAAAGFSYFFLLYTEKASHHIHRHSPLFVLVVRLLMSIFPSWLPTRSWKIFILLKRFRESNYLWILSCFPFQYRYLNFMASRRLVSSAFGVYYFENDSVVSRTVTYSLWAANNKLRWSSEWNEGRWKYNCVVEFRLGHRAGSIFNWIQRSKQHEAWMYELTIAPIGSFIAIILK